MTSKTRSKVNKVKFEEPIWLTYDQSDTTNVFKTFQGPNAEQEARDWASDKAERLKRPVAVFGPQEAVKVPPKRVTADDMPLAFKD